MVKDAGGSVITAPVVSWTSTNAAVVTFGVNGLASAVSNGSVYVRALVNGVVDSLPLTVLQRADAAKSPITVARPLLFVDDTVRATLHAHDALDHPLTFGGSAVVFSGSGGTSTGTFRPVADNDDGTYSADFIGVSRGSILTIGASIDGAGVISAKSLRVVGFTKIVAAGATVFGQQTTTGGLTCGIITTGDMYCWGIAWHGIRGNGETQPFGPGTAPTLVGGGHQWTDVAAGFWYVCAVATGGAVYCWGEASEGLLGNGNPVGVGSVSLPTPIFGNGTYRAVTISLSGGACAVTVTNAAMCWGSGVFGRLGNGADTLSKVPVPVSGGLSFDALHTTFSGTCGIAAGSAYCWGASILLGANGSPPDICGGPSTCAKTPFAVVGGHVFRPIVSIDGNVVCAVAADDQTYCWGSGYLGNGLITSAGSPTVVSGGLLFTSLTASDEGHCGTVVGGAAYCWGRNKNGRLGNGTTTEALVPTAISGGHAFTQLSSSQDHACGVTTDGNAWCWGGNDMGELGTGSQTPSLVPVRVRLF